MVVKIYVSLHQLYHVPCRFAGVFQRLLNVVSGLKTMVGWGLAQSVYRKVRGQRIHRGGVQVLELSLGKLWVHGKCFSHTLRNCF